MGPPRRWTRPGSGTPSRGERLGGRAREQDAPHPRCTFGDLAEQWIAVKERRWPPNTLQEHRRIVARNLRALHDVDVAKVTTRTVDVLCAELAARGGACTHRPCPLAPCPEHGPRCRRQKCKRPACPHKGACADWTPCDDQPCRHSAPLSAARVNRIRTVVRSALRQAVGGAGSTATPLITPSLARSSKRRSNGRPAST